MPEVAGKAWVSAALAATVLAVFAVIGATLVGLSYEATAERIAQNEREALLTRLNAILPHDRYDNPLLQDYLDVRAPEMLGGESTRIYIARRDGQPVAVILSPVVARGYSGDIKLIVGIHRDGRLAGVRVLAHRETPGLGDKIEAGKHPWILGFSGKSLQDPGEAEWKVRRDGGTFDQFTGATISPRAVVAAVKQALLFYRNRAGDLFTENSEDGKPADG